jgi:hypothetical protein
MSKEIKKEDIEEEEEEEEIKKSNSFKNNNRKFKIDRKSLSVDDYSLMNSISEEYSKRCKIK